MIRIPLLVLLGSGISVLNAVAQTPGTFVLTGSMAAPRIEGHTATLLRDGKVLITGGFPDLASAELYDPSSGTFTSAGTMTAPRNSHTATLLNDGRVLIAGGSYGRGPSAELYDPSTGTFTPTGAMVTADMYAQSAVLLGSGKVLISAASTRVRAADSVLGHAKQAIELEDIEARVSELERAAEGAQGERVR